MVDLVINFKDCKFSHGLSDTAVMLQCICLCGGKITRFCVGGLKQRRLTLLSGTGNIHKTKSELEQNIISECLWVTE